jgi:hypothetical protein
MLAGLFLLGVTAMADDKKDEKKPKAPYTEFVTVRRWISNQKEFLDPEPNVSAYRVKDKQGKEFIRLSAADAAGEPEPKSEITDKDGNMLVVTGKPFRSGADHVCPFEVKPKKPD